MLFQRRETEPCSHSYKSRRRGGQYWEYHLCCNYLDARDAEIQRDKIVAEAKKLLERATIYKEEAKREHEKVMLIVIVMMMIIMMCFR